MGDRMEMKKISIERNGIEIASSIEPEYRSEYHSNKKYRERYKINFINCVKFRLKWKMGANKKKKISTESEYHKCYSRK